MGVSCNSIGALIVGANATATITVTVPSSAADEATLSNSATSTATETDSNTANNTNVTEITTVSRQVDLSVTKSANLVKYGPGLPLTYTVVVSNAGGVTLIDTLPTPVAFVSATPGSPTCTETGGVVTCGLGPLAANASPTVMITVLVSTNASGTISNLASVSSDETDTSTGNNSVSGPTPLPGFTPLGLLALAGLMALGTLVTIRRRASA